MKKIFALIAALVMSCSLQAQESFEVATGDAKAGSTYSVMFNQLTKYCGFDLKLKEVESTGSVKNIEMLTSNVVKAAFAQSDLLFYYRSTDADKVKNVKTIFALYPEELHWVARSSKSEGGVLGFGAKNITFNTIADLKGRTVGAVGGSVLSARVFSSVSGMGLQVAEYPNNDALKQALVEGKIDAVLVVGGAPHKLVQSLDGRFRILSVDKATVDKLSTGPNALYKAAKLSYSNLGAAGVDTVAAESLLVTRTFRSPEMLSKLYKLRDCMTKRLPDIQDASGTHPKWQDVSSDNKGRWTWYDLAAQ